MNSAFESLRKAVPEFPTEPEDIDDSNNKLTKITTLRLAVNYIAALTQILKQTDPDSDQNQDCDNNSDALDDANSFLNSDFSLEDGENNNSVTSALIASLAEAFDPNDPLMLHRPSSCGSSDLPSCSSPSNTETSSRQSLESLKSSCWPDFSADDSLPDAFDLILESDGDSMELSDLIT